MNRFSWVLIFGMGLSLAVRAGEARPNILFAIADDWGFGDASAYGSKWVATPAFDRIAKEGLLFTRAYTPNAKCAPSRAILLTGRNSWQLKEAANHMCYFPAEFKAFPEALAENGYRVGMTGKGWGPGEAKDGEGKERQLTGLPFAKRKLTPVTSGIHATDYASNFEDFLATTKEGEPWCFWYGALEPHRGYEYGSGVAKGSKSLDQIDRVPGYWPDTEEVRHDMLDYALEVEHYDAHLGRMIQKLEEVGQLENTLIVATSDHGMPFPRCKGQAYEASNHIPLAMMWPKGIAAPGRVLEDYISFIDLAPTFLEVAGVAWEAAGMAPTPGRSLGNLFASSEAGRVDAERDFVLIGKERHDTGRPDDQGYPIRGIIRDGMLYLRNYEIGRWPAGNPETGYLNCDAGATKSFILSARREKGSDLFWELCFGKRSAEELYEVKYDRDCVTNLAGKASMAAVQAALREEMETRLKAQEDPRMAGRGHVFDEYPMTRGGFYRAFMAGEDPQAGWVSESDFEAAPVEAVKSN